MPTILMLVVALQGGSWQCQENERGLWECRAPVKVLRSDSPDVLRPDAESITRSVLSTNADNASSADSGAPAAGASDQQARPSQSPPAVMPDQSAPGRSGTAPEATAAVAQADADAWIVQIGAYRSPERAQQAARDAADAAGADYIDAHPRGSYWVRSAAGLRRVLKPQGEM